MRKSILLSLILSFLCIVSVSAQHKMFEPIESDSIEILREKYGNQKIYPGAYESQFLLALKHYPELKDVTIKLKFSKEKTTMACRPDIGSLFRKKRIYHVYINDKSQFKGILLEDVPFNAQVGVIGHELAHIVDYENKNIFQIIGTGIGYLFGGYKKRLEHRIDLMTIDHCLGWQLHDWAKFAMYDSKATPKYKLYKKKIYMGPEKILTLME